MADVRDPVCKMMIEQDTAAGRSTYKGETFYFCSPTCLEVFETDPVRYIKTASAGPSSAESELERHEPPYTKVGGIVAPKFGAAGSGGAEYERLPEAHDREKGDDR